MILIFLLLLPYLSNRMMKSPCFSKSPTWTISSWYVSLCFENLRVTHVAQGYCEGVVGRFSGLDVKFLGRLKKPVMTKRASLGAASVSALSGKSDGKSPTSSSTAEPHSPAPHQPQRRESQQPRQPSTSRRASSSLSPTRTFRDVVLDPINRIPLVRIKIHD